MYRFRTTCNVIYTVDFAQHAKEFEDLMIMIMNDNEMFISGDTIE